jgi:hypothetical protein
MLVCNLLLNGYNTNSSDSDELCRAKSGPNVHGKSKKASSSDLPKKHNEKGKKQKAQNHHGTCTTYTMNAPCIQQQLSDSSMDDLPRLVLYDDDDDDHASTASSRATVEDEQDAAYSAADTIVPFPIRRLQVLLKMQTPLHGHADFQQDSSMFSKKNDFIAVYNDNAKSHSGDSFLALRQEQDESSTLMNNAKQRFTLLRKTHSEPLLLCASQRWLSSSTSATTTQSSSSSSSGRRQDCAPTLPARRHPHSHYLHMKKANSEPLLLPSHTMNSHRRWQSDRESKSSKSDTGKNNNKNNNNDNHDKRSNHSCLSASKAKNKATLNNTRQSSRKRRDYAPRLPQRCRSVIFSC